jgi:hypothetical protein
MPGVMPTLLARACCSPVLQLVGRGLALVMLQLDVESPAPLSAHGYYAELLPAVREAVVELWSFLSASCAHHAVVFMLLASPCVCLRSPSLA